MQPGYRPLLAADEEFPGGDPLRGDDAEAAAPARLTDAPAPAAATFAAAALRSASSALSRARRALRPLSQLPLSEQLLALLALLLAVLTLLVAARGGGPAGAPPPPPPAPPPSPAVPPPGGRAPPGAWERHLQQQGFATPRPLAPSSPFLALWRSPVPGRPLLLQVPPSLVFPANGSTASPEASPGGAAAAAAALVLVTAAVSRADGRSYLLHQPLGEGYWLFRAASPDADADAGLEAVVPPLGLVRLWADSTLAGAAAGHGLWAAPLAALPRWDAGPAGGPGTAACHDGSVFVDATAFLTRSFALAVDPDGAGALLARAMAAAPPPPSSGGPSVAVASARAPGPSNLELELVVTEAGPGGSGAGVGVRLSLAAAPAEPMLPRLAPPAALGQAAPGYFSTCFAALGGGAGAAAGDAGAGADAAPGGQDGRRCVLSRWRLARGAAAAPGCGQGGASPACPYDRPITFHLDPSVPPKWAPCFAHGVAAWDAAFRAAGWAAGAVRALRPGDPAWPADYDAADTRFSSITFAPSLGDVYAVGPATVDPRSGEIVNSDSARVLLRRWLGKGGGRGGLAPG